MANFTTATPSLDQAYSDWQNYGEWRQSWYAQSTASTADGALSTNGGTTAQRFTNPLIVPAVTAPTTGYVITGCDMYTFVASSSMILANEFLLGTLTVNGNSFSHNAAMPTRTIRGTSMQTGSIITMLVVSTTLTATTPTITVTYTNQAGTANQSATIALPTSPVVNSAFILNRRLASGDVGVQDITNMSISTGSAGVIKAYGLLPIALGGQTETNNNGIFQLSPLNTPLPMVKALPNDTLSFYNFGVSASARDFYAAITGIPEQ